MIAKQIALALVAFYVIVLITDPQFGIVDDHQVATTRRVADRPHFPLSAGVSTKTARFEPLDGQEYTVLGAFFDFTPRMCYSFNAAQLVLFVIISVLFLKEFVADRWAYTGVALVLASPGFVAAWFRLYAGERGALFWALASLWGIQRMGRLGHWRWLLMAVSAANLALYYKEPVFAGMATFAGLELIATVARRQWSRKNLAHVLMLVSAVLFLAIYCVMIARHQTGNYADQRRGVSTAVNQLFNVRLYMLIAYPLVFFVVVPDAVAAGIRAIRTRFAQTSTLDSLSIAALTYVALIAVLNLPPNCYYLLPAYAFGLAPIAKRLSSINWSGISWSTWALVVLGVVGLCACPLTWIAPQFEKHTLAILIVASCLVVCIVRLVVSGKERSRIPWQISAAAAVVCALTNQVPASFNQMITAKYAPWSFQCVLDELRGAVRASKPGPVPIFLVESPRGYYTERYHSIGEYLRLQFEGGRDFDIRSEVPAEPKFVPDPQSPFSVFRDASAISIKTGALLVAENYSDAQLERWSTYATVVCASSRPRWLYMVSLDSAIQRLKSKVRGGLGDPNPPDPTIHDFCLMVAR